MLEPSVLACPFGPFDWQAGHRYCELQLSLNGGADFGTAYGPIRLLEPPRAPRLASFTPAASSQAVAVTVPVYNTTETTSSLGCLATAEDGESWFLPSTYQNETHARCYDGHGLLENGGQIQVLDVSAGLVSVQASLELELPRPEETLVFDDSNKTASSGASTERANATVLETWSEDIPAGGELLTGPSVVRTSQELQVLTISEDGTADPLPALVLEGRARTAGEEYKVRLESLQPYWNEQRWNFSAMASAPTELPFRV